MVSLVTPAGRDSGRDAAAATDGRQMLLLIAGLYVTQGLTMGLAFEALPIMLRQAGVPLELLALVPLASLPWILKFLWAPLVDNRWSARLGRRRSWMIPAQFLLAATLLAMGLVPFELGNAGLLAALLGLATVTAATQDTATDGLAAERLRGSALASANGLQVGGMLVGFMIGGSGLLIARDSIGLPASFAILAAIPLVSALFLLAWREGSPAAAAAPRASLAKTLRRPGFAAIAVLCLVYGLAHVGGSSFTRLLLVDAGWSSADVGLAGAFGNVVMIAVGCPIGARMTSRHGLWRAMALGLVLGAISLAFWALPAFGLLPLTTTVVAVATGLVGVAGGLIAVSASTLAMRFGGDGGQAGTDVTVLQSANVLGEMLIASLVVWAASLLGYGWTLVLAAFALVGVLALVRRTKARTALDSTATEARP